MSEEKWSATSFVLWSTPLLLLVLVVTLAWPHHKVHSVTTTSVVLTSPVAPSAAINQNAIAGTLTNATPVEMVPIPHAGRWFLQTSNSASSQLVCANAREAISGAFVVPVGSNCQVVIIAIHLPISTTWRLANA